MEFIGDKIEMEFTELKKRVKILGIKPEQVIQMLFWEKGKKIVLPILPEELRDAVVLSADWDFPRQCFCILLCHPKWPLNPPGQEPEWINFALEQTVVEIKGAE